VRRITPAKVVERFLDIAAAAEQGPAAVRELVDDDEYARAFIEGFAKGPRMGKSVDSILKMCSGVRLSSAQRGSTPTTKSRWRCMARLDLRVARFRSHDQVTLARD